MSNNGRISKTQLGSKPKDAKPLPTAPGLSFRSESYMADTGLMLLTFGLFTGVILGYSLIATGQAIHNIETKLALMLAGTLVMLLFLVLTLVLAYMLARSIADDKRKDLVATDPDAGTEGNSKASPNKKGLI